MVGMRILQKTWRQEYNTTDNNTRNVLTPQYSVHHAP